MSDLARILEESLETVVERAGDPAPAVYAALFARWPDLEPLFQRDVNGDVRAEMFLKTIECLQDLAGPNLYAANFIACEIVNHDGVGVPREVFPLFFEVTGETLASLAGEGWTPAYAEGWRQLIGRARAAAARA